MCDVDGSKPIIVRSRASLAEIATKILCAQIYAQGGNPYSTWKKTTDVCIEAAKTIIKENDKNDPSS